MVCLETMFLIDVLQDARGIREAIKTLEEPLFIASPSVMELWIGALRARFPEKEKSRVSELLVKFSVLPFNEHSAKEAAEIQFQLSRKGETIGTSDLMIAAIAIANGEKLVTRDQAFARIDKLRMEKY